MRLFLRLLVLLVVLALLLVGIAFALPDRVHVERSVTIARPSSQIFLVLNDLRRFNAWSPWYERDPNARYTFSGPETGVGAKLAWSSQRRDVGEGSQTIVAVVTNESVTLELDFGPMGKPQARFDLAYANGDTRVTWSLDNTLPLHLDERFGWNLVGRYMGLFMDRMVGADFEHGLGKLKQLVEGFPNVDVGGIAPQLVELPARRLIFVSVAAEADDAATLRAWNAALAQLTRFATQQGLTLGGAPLALTRARAPGDWRFELALPAHYDVMPEDTDVRGRELGAGRAVQLSHDGVLAERLRLVDKLRAWAQVKGLYPGDLLIEEFGAGADALQGSVRLSIPLLDAAPR